MEEYLAAAVVLAFLLGYVGLAAGVGLYASNRGWNFLIFFLLALFFNPPLVFIGVVFLSLVWDPTNAQGLAEGARSLTQTDTGGTQEARTDRPSGGTSESRVPDERASEPSTRSTDRSVTPDDLPLTKESSSDDPMSEGDSLETSYDEDTSGRKEEGKVRCDTCYSFIDESASECPACGADLGSGGFF